MNRSTRIVEQLGISHGAAANRLRKNILFSLLCRLNENVCFKCKLVIEKVEDLSIEHKQPWEGRSAELFWDLNNIAFSHLRCNQPHVRGNGSEERRKQNPPGMNWCYQCKAFLPVENFVANKSRWTGLHTECKECLHYNRD